MSIKLEFRIVDAPPPGKPGPGRPPAPWRRFGEAHPGQWFVMRAGAPKSNSMNLSRYPGWTFANRKADDGTWTTYAKYEPEVPA